MPDVTVKSIDDMEAIYGARPPRARRAWRDPRSVGVKRNHVGVFCD